MSFGSRLVPLTGGTQDQTPITTWEPRKAGQWAVEIFSRKAIPCIHGGRHSAQKRYLSSFCDSILSPGISWEIDSRAVSTHNLRTGQAEGEETLPTPRAVQKNFL